MAVDALKPSFAQADACVGQAAPAGCATAITQASERNATVTARPDPWWKACALARGTVVLECTRFDCVRVWTARKLVWSANPIATATDERAGCVDGFDTLALIRTMRAHRSFNQCRTNHSRGGKHATKTVAGEEFWRH